MNSKIVNDVPKIKQVKSTSWREEMDNMEKKERRLRIYTDDLIRQFKKVEYGRYELNPAKLDGIQKSSLIDMMYLNDPTTQEFLNQRMEELIEERIGWVESEDMVEKGLSPMRDSVNGEFRWVRR